MSTFIHLAEIERQKKREVFSKKKKFFKKQYEFIIENYIGKYENLTFRNFVKEENFYGRNIFLLRHDIDHDYETALRMAEWEYMKGLRATYCVLHSSWYYGLLVDGCYQHTDELIRLCKELSSMGHEINLHNNFVTVALNNGIDVKTVIKQELDFFRSHGIEISGTSSHGDVLCRKLNYRNYEIFQEAVSDIWGGQRTIKWENREINVGCISFEKLGLTYEIYDIPMDIYLSDAGGRVKTAYNVKPRHNFISRNYVDANHIVGILTHPIWWDFS